MNDRILEIINLVIWPIPQIGYSTNSKNTSEMTRIIGCNSFYLFFLLSIASLMHSCAPNPTKTEVSVSGNVKDMDSTKVYLEQNHEKLDSAVINNGSFSLTAEVWNNIGAELVFYGKAKPSSTSNVTSLEYSITFFVEHGASYNFFAQGMDQIGDHDYKLETNSALAKELYALDQAIFKRIREQKALIKRYEAKRDSRNVFSDSSVYKMLDDSVAYHQKLYESTVPDLHKKVISKNPNSYLSLYLLSYVNNFDNDKEFYINIEKQLTDKSRENYNAQEFIKALAKVRTDLPVQLDFDAADVKDVAFSFDKYQNNKAIVVDFWATWCAPCVEVMPDALVMESRLKEKNIGYIFLSYDSRIKTWKNASSKLGLKHSYRINQASKPILDEKLRMKTIPRYILINSQGDLLAWELPSPADPKFLISIDSALSSKQKK